jgi:hypothetical protein
MTAVREKSSNQRVSDADPESAADNIGSEALQDFSWTDGSDGLKPRVLDMNSVVASGSNDL